jgi:hypothetical protein
LIASWQHHGRTDDEIYDELEVMFPDHGHPLSWYEYAESINPENHNIAVAAKKKIDSDVRQASAAAMTEYDKKRKCVELEWVEREKSIQICSITKKGATHRMLAGLDASLAIKVGDFVNVQPDLSPSKMSHGGKGFVTGKETKEGVSTFIVKYLETEAGSRNNSESGIPVSRLVVTPFAVSVDGAKRRPRNEGGTPDRDADAAEHPTNSIKTRLQEGFSNGLAKGWRRLDFSKQTMTRVEITEKMLPDCLWLRGYLEGHKRSPEQYQTSGRFKGKRTKFADAFSWKFLAYSWGVGDKRCRSVLASLNTGTKEKSFVPGNVIDCAQTARFWYTAETMFVRCRVIEMKEEVENLAYEHVTSRNTEFREKAKVEWTELSDDERENWEAIAREHDEIQPYIKGLLIDAIIDDPNKSFERLSADIGYWCSASTIHRWLQQYPDYKNYVNRLLPSLSDDQKKKHVQFAKHVRARWNLPPGKYIWLHYDEKWFWGFVGRGNAKMAPSAGIKKSTKSAYHRSHIDKVMSIAFTGFAFDTEIENGGDGLKIGFFRCQAARIAKKQVRESRRTETGELRFDGPVKRHKGDAYLVDANVTGSDAGTSDKPKFALKPLWQDSVFPHLDEITGPGGEYEGYTVIGQGDNAGPHCDKTYLDFCKTEFENRGWHWEPQAPQMPHANNLDIAVFPAMSKRHSQVLRDTASKGVAPPDEIWKAAEDVWTNLDSATIARGFLLVYRILEKVIQHNGSNEFLRDKEFHSSVRKDFQSTAKGIIHTTE